tara:strand:+ start:639 stop:839 length:201 start_codon:yes stop_codon:yes gene_type:complete
MSRLQKKTTMVATEVVEQQIEEMESVPQQVYEAQHPALAYLKEVKLAAAAEDHLDNYVEVHPYEEA